MPSWPSWHRRPPDKPAQSCFEQMGKLAGPAWEPPSPIEVGPSSSIPGKYSRIFSTATLNDVTKFAFQEAPQLLKRLQCSCNVPVMHTGLTWACATGNIGCWAGIHFGLGLFALASGCRGPALLRRHDVPQSRGSNFELNPTIIVLPSLVFVGCM